MNARTSVALTCASATRRSLSMGHFSPSTAAAAAWRFEVAAVYAPGIIIISSWVPGVLEAKSWGTRISLGTTVGDAACRSMLLLVVLSLCISCYTAVPHRASADNNKQQCCWLSLSIIGSSGGTAVKSAALSWLPPLVWRCLLAVATVCCLGSLLCGLTVWYQVLYALVYVRILGWSCVVRSFQGVWFMLRHYNHLFCFAATPDCPV